MEIFISNIKQPILEFLHSLNHNIDWEKAFSQGMIRVRKYFVGRNFILSPGDQVIYDPELTISEPKVNFNYTIIYEDQHLVAINKPVPLPIHPTGTYFHHTLTNHLQSQGKLWRTINRLDSETSGALILAKKPEETETLRQSFLAGQKTYLALVYGDTPTDFTVEMPLGRKLKSKVFRRQGYSSTGKNSLTRFRKVCQYTKKNQEKLSLLLALPKTGRSHQIRAHLSETGYQVVGDKIYGKDEMYFIRYLKEGLSKQLKNKLELERQFLHCYKVEMIHPFTKEKIRFISPSPSDLVRYLEKLKKSNC